MSNKEALKQGTQIDSGHLSYCVETVIGQGGFGITYKVKCTIKVGKVDQVISFAIKEHFLDEMCQRDHATNRVSYPAPSKAKVENSKIDFLAEARRLNQIQHPNIVAVNEVFEANDTAYYVMEYIEGESLRNYVTKKGALSEQEALDIMLPIANAINYLHHNRMTHLDIKPDNIMLRPESDGSFTPVLIDFGLSKHYDETGRATSQIRTLGCSNGYAPMEQYAGILTFSPQADIYAVGATLLYALTGTDPAMASEISEDIIRESLSEDISPKVTDAIVQAMQMLKPERTASATELIKNLASEDAIMPLSEIEPTQQKKKEQEKEKEKKKSFRLKSQEIKHNTVIAPIQDDDDTAVQETIINISTQKESKKPTPSKASKSGKTIIYIAAMVAVLLLTGGATWFLINNNKNDGASIADTLIILEENPGTNEEPHDILDKANAVDLGLSVLWCDCNIGATSPEQSGSYFAWGETRTKQDYSWNTYKFWNDKNGNKQPYNNASATETSEFEQIGNNIASGQYDAATAELGGNWSIPTKEQWQELISKCSWQWTSENGVKGYRVSRNGKSIFLPASGINYGTSINGKNAIGSYWSANISTDIRNAYGLSFNANSHRLNSSYSRNNGFPIRPVKSK